MKFNEIPSRLNLSKSQILADLNEIKKMAKQTLTPYWSGKRFKPSDMEKRVMINYDLSREVVFFRPAFVIHDQDTPQYWLSLALEALTVAKSTGCNIDEIEKLIVELGQSLEEDFDPTIFEDEKND